jgi:hypothetical protein
MSRVRFDPTVPVFERVKIFHILEHAATLIGCYIYRMIKNLEK